MWRIRTILIFFAISLFLIADAQELPRVRSLTPRQADSLARKQVFYKDRVVPFHTVASDVTVKLTGKRNFGKLDPVRFVSSLIVFPSDWVDVPLLKISDKRLADSLEVRKGDMIPISVLFDEYGDYKLRNFYLSGDEAFDKAILDLDEKIEILLLLRTNSLFQPLQDSGIEPLPEWKVSLEIFFNKVHIVTWLFIVAFSISLIGILSICFKQRNFLWLIYIFPALISLADFILRWLIGGFIPLADGEQVMIFMSMILFIMATISCNSKPWIATAMMVMGAFTSLVARLSASNPVITAISPALASPWLAFHVSVIMMSYAFLAVMFPLSIALECVKREKGEGLAKWCRNVNIIGVVLLGLGIILGSLWAKEAWGRYWSWDPKENWAAITFFVYLLPLSLGNRIIKNYRLYGIILIIAFFMMIITYFGVNYFIGGMHSYA